MAKQASIELKNLTKEYVTHEGTGTFLAVDHINVNIGSGEFVTLLGPSGCGKTTTLRMIAGFESVSGGDILLDGIRINEMTPDKRDSSMVFQSYALFPHYDVYDNVAYGLVNKKMDKKTIREKVMQMVELVGLKGLEHRMPNQLSGGQQQRVALARALVMEPAVLLFDEPLSNLDAKLRVYMRKEIRKIQQRIGITSVYVTHDQAEAMSLSDKIIIMNKGHIEQVGTPHEVYQHPASRFVADFIGSANFVKPSGWRTAATWKRRWFLRPIWVQFRNMSSVSVIRNLKRKSIIRKGSVFTGREIKYGSASSGTRSTPWRTERNLDTRHGCLSIEEKIHFKEAF